MATRWDGAFGRSILRLVYDILENHIIIRITLGSLMPMCLTLAFLPNPTPILLTVPLFNLGVFVL